MQNLPKIGVLGGSFNPPTLAHKILLTIFPTHSYTLTRAPIIHK